jgi:hypothetical protein
MITKSLIIASIRESIPEHEITREYLNMVIVQFTGFPKAYASTLVGDFLWFSHKKFHCMFTTVTRQSSPPSI